MPENLFTAEFWQTEAAVAWSNRWAIVPLLLIVGLLIWRIRGWLDDREIRGLRAENDAADRLLKLAQSEQKAVTEQVKILEPNSTKLETEFAALKIKVARMEAVLPQLDRVASTTAIVTSTARALSEANTVLGATLAGSGALHADASMMPKVTSKSE